MNVVRHWWRRGLGAIRDLGPYAVLELVLPGGSVLALLLWLYRRHKRLEVHS